MDLPPSDDWLAVKSNHAPTSEPVSGKILKRVPQCVENLQRARRSAFDAPTRKVPSDTALRQDVDQGDFIREEDHGG
jgi:hypothetical protein